MCQNEPTWSFAVNCPEFIQIGVFPPPFITHNAENKYPGHQLTALRPVGKPVEGNLGGGILQPQLAYSGD